MPAVVAAQFSHTMFCALLKLRATVHEAFALANHVVQAHCTAAADGQYLAPSLPSLYSPLKAVLPDNSSIPQPALPGIDSSTSLATAVPGMHRTHSGVCTCWEMSLLVSRQFDCSENLCIGY